jgi:plasmid stability protein
MASNLTITVDDEALRRARIRALEQGTSVNAILREFLEAYAGTRQSHMEAAERLLTIAEENPGKRGRAKWSRDDLHLRES